VFVVAVSAGSVGLTLNAANHVILCDQITDRTQEEQACNRVYRLGQRKDVVIHHLIGKDTIEEQMYLLNEFRQSKELNFGQSNRSGGPAFRTKHHKGGKFNGKKNNDKNNENNDQLNNFSTQLDPKLFQMPFITTEMTKTTSSRPTIITPWSTFGELHGSGGLDYKNQKDAKKSFFVLDSDDENEQKNISSIRNQNKITPLLSSKSQLSSNGSNGLNKHEDISAMFSGTFEGINGDNFIDLKQLEQEENSLKQSFEGLNDHSDSGSGGDDSDGDDDDDDGGGSDGEVSIAGRKNNGKNSKAKMSFGEMDYSFLFCVGVGVKKHEHHDDDQIEL